MSGGSIETEVKDDAVIAWSLCSSSVVTTVMPLAHVLIVFLSSSAITISPPLNVLEAKYIVVTNDRSIPILMLWATFQRKIIEDTKTDSA